MQEARMPQPNLILLRIRNRPSDLSDFSYFDHAWLRQDYGTRITFEGLKWPSLAGFKGVTKAEQR
jgi:hypothetical protein